MKHLHVETPFFESLALSEKTGRTVWLKMDANQPPGSFKIRGIGFACQEYVRNGAKRLISSSGGNAGIAVAYAGRLLSVPVVVVVPETTTEIARALIRQEGAELIIHGASWHEANALAMSMVSETDAFLHPFDDPLVWKGHATMIDEVAGTGIKPDVVVLSVGGGGLLCGVIEGLHRNGWNDIPVVAVETDGADSFARAVCAGERIELPAISSIATSLGAKQVCEQAFNWRHQHAVLNAVVSDQAAVSACLRFLGDHRVLVEPACGASLATVYDCDPALEAFRSVMVVVCGGAVATLAQLQQWSGEAD